jgi:flagellar biosynthetic protein FliR
MTLWDESLALAELARSGLNPAALVFLRVGAIMALLPAFGEQVVPARVRLVMALAFTAVVFPAVAPQTPPILTLTAAGIEVAVGLMLGIGLRLLVLALQFAGSIAAQSASLSQLFASAGAEPQPAVSTLFTVSALALAVQSGLHVRAAEVMIRSYDLFPVGDWPQAAAAADWGVAQVARATALAFTLAAPFVLAALVWNLALGVMNRAMPMLPVSFLGAPALSLGALAVTALTAVAALTLWQGVLDRFLTAPMDLP